MSSTPAEARIEQLEHIEEDVIAILKSCGNCLIDIAKDRPSQGAVDQSVQTVMNNIKSVDSKLSEQIKYLTQVSTGHPHEGSSYPSQKVLQSAWHRLEHVKTRISELDRLRQQAGLTPAQKQALQQQQQQQQQQVKQQLSSQQQQQQQTVQNSGPGSVPSSQQ